MARGNDKSSNQAPPRRNPFRQEILTKEEAAVVAEGKESITQKIEEDTYPEEGLKHLARLAGGISATPRDPRSHGISMSAQELQQAALAEIYESGFISYLAAAGWGQEAMKAVYAMAQEQEIAAWPTSKSYLDIALALGICFSPKEIKSASGAFEEDLIHFNQLLMSQDSSQLEGARIILERDDEDLNKREILDELEKITLPFRGKSLLPPPGFTDRDIDSILSLLEREGGPAFALQGQGREAFLLGLWLGLWANYREKVVYLPKN